MSVIRRGGATLGMALLGFVLASACYLWWGRVSAVLIGITGILATTFALGRLYHTGGPARFGGASLTIGVLATIALYTVGVLAVRDVALTLVGVETTAVVEREWTTRERGTTTSHCTLRHADGTPIQRELHTDCRGREPGDTVQVVFDREGRLPTVAGPKDDMPTVGEIQATGAAGLVLLASIAMGSVPTRRTGPR
ncbi:hypothetical protein ACN3XK_56755 [Actinomadura welshii]